MQKVSLDLLNAQIDLCKDKWTFTLAVECQKLKYIIVCARGCTINFNELRETMKGYGKSKLY